MKVANPQQPAMQRFVEAGVQDTVDPKGTEIVCPVIRAGVNEGILKLDENGMVAKDNIDDYVEALLGAKGGGIVASSLGDVKNAFRKKFNPDHLRNGLLDHANDTGILRNGHYDEKAFTQLVERHSSDGKNMTLSDFMNATKTNAREDKKFDFVGTAIAKVEAKILFQAFGVENAQGELSISIADLRNLYQNKTLPSTVQSRILAVPSNNVSTAADTLKSSALGGTEGASMSGVQRFSGEGGETAQGALAAQGLKTGICPVGGVDVGAVQANPDTTAVHNEVFAK